jgi:hypothetical protein
MRISMRFPRKKNHFFVRIMTNYSEYPPIKYFTRVLKNCPKSAYLYVQLWTMDVPLNFTLYKKHIRRDFLISPTLFRNLLAPLASLNIINFTEWPERYRIDLIGKTDDDL